MTKENFDRIDDDAEMIDLGVVSELAEGTEGSPAEGNDHSS